ncbi:DUF3794 domain-containing protein [Clostridium aestuarii]|uniref:DUF3794 domain-containing protein n=1 Tax=Clostridium aestuarii TaxID=338193 RepID=A0ABT4CW05_9CLOT|nr:DUF3794 domain-containing protein [Clostridium aestuarii]MCY6483168.1 DUF3794 domain-containing protein [Clostridium aestuarii]
MNCIENDMIHVSGLCDPNGFDLASPNNSWTEISVPETLTIPEQKPDIEQINSVNASVEIFRKKVIVTPNSDGENEEGKILTGRKLIIEGNLCQAIEYTALEEKQSVHTAHFKIPFSAFIVLKDLYDFSTVTDIDPLDLDFDVKACVEDVFIQGFNTRQIFKNVTLFLQAVPRVIPECEDEDCECEEDQILTKGVCSVDKLVGMLGTDEDTWTEIFIPEFLNVPCQKPEIEQLLSVSSRVMLLSQKVVKTPGAFDSTGVPVDNKEGTKLTNRKLIIEGILRQKVIYTADVPEQSVHSTHFDVPFSAFIVLPKDTLLSSKFKIEPCIEDIFACKLDKKLIFKNITLFIKATQITCV